MYEQFSGYFGGGAGYDHQGNWQTPNFKVKIFNDDGSEKMQSYTNVADVFDGMNVAFTSFENKVNHQITQKVNDVVANIVGGDSLVQYDQKKHRITIGSAVKKDPFWHKRWSRCTRFHRCSEWFAALCNQTCYSCIRCECVEIFW
ncbi:hypothetical protein ABID23_001085 [Bartonella silvatica]|uniref:Uncharacterized protein n=1 Tax=Bartonella silvatica TaxID=357760 RepID=A0ABV2HHF9_9HYPH